MSFNVNRKRNYTGDNSTAGHGENEGPGGTTWDCSGRANGSSSVPLRQEEKACPDRVCFSSCPPLAHGGTAHPGVRQGVGLMQEIISETSPKAPLYQARAGGTESRPDIRNEPTREINCTTQDHLPSEATEDDWCTGNASLRREISHENEAEFEAEWSPRAYHESDDPGEDNHTAGIDDDEQTETTTSDEDEDGDGTRSDPLLFSKSTKPLPQPRDDVVGGDSGSRTEAIDDTSTTSRSSAAEGTPRVLGSSPDNVRGHHLQNDAELEVLWRPEIDGGAFESAGGFEASAASTTTTTQFRCCTPDTEKPVFVKRDKMDVGRQPQQRHRLPVESPKHPLGQPHHHHQHQHQRQRRRRYQHPQPLWQQPKRRISAGDQVDRSGGNIM